MTTFMPTSTFGAKGSQPAVHGADGQPLVYPAPLRVRNTFIEVQTGRPASLEGFLQERQAFSLPTSLISEPGAELLATDVTGVKVGGFGQVPYQPGALLAQSALFLDQDVRSECSTMDTVRSGSRTAPPSPPRELVAFQPVAPATVGLVAPMLEQQVPVLRLEEALAEPKIASDTFPTVGSAGHYVGQCKPCAFYYTKGCGNGAECKFCHLCENGEKKRRQKDKRAFLSTMRHFRRVAQQSLGLADEGQD